MNYPKRKTHGRDRSKNYHKITISVDEKAKQEIIEYAREHNISISKLIKNLLIKNSIISSEK
ncbi:DUF6364 family protein [Sulfurimonas sp.]|uniref:DUF6364 family protein n=1 Tax=Sulfurimonas sp. TaxID=2022749 RepID=UPI00345DA91A